jgi:hypothetical protein
MRESEEIGNTLIAVICRPYPSTDIQAWHMILRITFSWPNLAFVVRIRSYWSTFLPVDRFDALVIKRAVIRNDVAGRIPG